MALGLGSTNNEKHFNCLLTFDAHGPATKRKLCRDRHHNHREAVSDPYAPTSENITRLSYEVAKLQNSINLLSQRQRELKAEIEEVDESSVGWYTIFCVCWIGFMP